MPDFLKSLTIISVLHGAARVGELYGGWVGIAIAGTGLLLAVILGIVWYFDWAYERKQMDERLDRVLGQKPWL